MFSNSVLQFHYHPAKGWMNDPNGLVWFDGYYHAFYQCAPHFEQPWHEPMVWGHARTKDFLHWEELPIALSAGDSYDKGGAWSGTAIVKDGVLWLFYASVTTVKPEGTVQTISVAFSTDGIHFEKYEGNPVIASYPADGSRDFRDPAIFTENGVNYLVVASANPAVKTGNLLLYRAEDFFHWEYVGVLLEYENARFCECPSFVRAGDGYLLACSVVREKEHFFEVLYGDFDGKRFTPSIVSRFQKGPDEYAGQVFHAPDGRNILISWIPGWQSEKFERCVGCLSLPLELTANEEEGKIRAYPVKEVRHLLRTELDGTEVATDGYIREIFVDRGAEVYIKTDLFG